MRKDIMEKWTAALRSGEYKQGTERLNDKSLGAYCCLGVLCELAPDDVRDQHAAEYARTNDEYLTSIIMKWADIKHPHGGLPKPYKKKTDPWTGTYSKDLTVLNDSGLSFKQIANIIERNYKEL